MNKFTILDSISGQLEAILKSQVQPEIKGIGNIALYIISGVLLLVLIVRGVFVWKDYHQGGELKWGILLAVFICLVICHSAPSWIWGIIGW